ncbi:MAG: hypothetical protein PHO41_03185, partial [Eubacteriales bacterium]|nr:hypothetical protein [Eubacteriales bacterium]
FLSIGQMKARCTPIVIFEPPKPNLNPLTARGFISINISVLCQTKEHPKDALFVWLACSEGFEAA